ncbi:Vacuolar inheritance and morphology protein [Ceratocystis pirilliformis]|uniref:Vacuolar inheritance and morphology protein n=1 Tax=Ceratocystis pirilliformis TaxID=259994 RepID=A0ABR3ZEB1_9PEZI
MQRAQNNAPGRYISSSANSSASEMSESDTDDHESAGLRTPTMNNPNPLATVQEASQPNSPGHATQDTAMTEIHTHLVTDDSQNQNQELQTPQTPSSQDSDNMSAASVRTIRARNVAPYNDSDHTTSQNDARKPSTSVPQPPMMSRQSSAYSTFNKTKPTTDGSSMIVESETVTSVPQIALATIPQGPSGTLRAMPSTETIRPKKDRKRQTRKQPMNPASSKAEVFEYKVASAVDEADDSDSDETFVYDSNPHDGPRRYHHSRTPSTTSMASQVDRPMRSIHSVMDVPGPSTSSKKNMKFANTYNNASDTLTGDEDGRGSSRSNIGSSRNSTRHQHHLNKYGRNQNSHASLFDNESPFVNPARAKMQANSRQNSGPPSPRFLTSRSQASRQTGSYNLSNAYDMDETGPDDERTPLISYSRSNRPGRQSRRGPTPRHIESQTYRSRPSALNRLAACLVVTMMVLVVITGAIGFMFATSQPLTDIKLVAIENVIASEPELMFDLTIRAHNPNIVVVTIDNANLEIFAKSVHAGTDADWYNSPSGGPGDKFKFETLDEKEVHAEDDPPDDMPDESAPNMRLGTIQEFDSPLSFEGLFFHKGLSVSTGGVRLPLPGNSTTGGSERWGKVIQDDFDLIVKGIIKYYLPLSQRMRSVSISGRTRVKPNSASNPSLKPNITMAGSLGL